MKLDQVRWKLACELAKDARRKYEPETIYSVLSACRDDVNKTAEILKFGHQMQVSPFRILEMLELDYETVSKT